MISIFEMLLTEMKTTQWQQNFEKEQVTLNILKVF